MAALQTSFDSIERIRRELEAVLSALSPAELCFRPGPQRWSILMTLERIGADTAGLSIFRHPFGGHRDANETLEFLTVHLDHRMRQIARIREAFARQA